MTNTNLGFKCVECGEYIIPPQIFTPESLKLCKCELSTRPEFKIKVERLPKMPDSDPAVRSYISRLVRLDEARLADPTPRGMYVVPRRKKSISSILRHMWDIVNMRQLIP